MPTDRRVVIWRSALLPPSETFVRNPGDALTRWRPTYLGATRFDSPLSRPDDVIAYPRPTDRRAFLRLRLTGFSPRLEHLLAEQRPDLVHAHFGGDGWLISGSAMRLRVPLIVTVHGHDVTRQPQTPGPKGIRYRQHLRIVFQRAALILAVSDVIRDRALRWGADPAKVRVHHTGVPLPPSAASVSSSPARTAPPPPATAAEVAATREPATESAATEFAATEATASGLPADKEWDVVFVGRFVEKKGVDDLLTALAAIPGVRCLLIGDGPLFRTMLSYAERLGVTATFAGSLPPADVHRLLASSRVLAAPSKTARDGDTEGLPTTILEAAALGLPVAATVHSGIPEAVAHGETGLLSPEADPPALAANLRRLLDDDALRTRLGEQAREQARSRFDVAAQTRRLEDLYDEAVQA